MRRGLAIVALVLSIAVVIGFLFLPERRAEEAIAQDERPVIGGTL